MNLIEFIGFIISMAALIIMGVKKAQEERRRREHPEEYRREQLELERRRRQLYEQSDEEDDEFEEEEEEVEEESHRRHVPPPPPPVPIKPLTTAAKPILPRAPLPPVGKSGESFGFKPKLSDYKTKTSIEQRTLASKLDSRYQQDKNDAAYISPYESKAYDAITTSTSSRAGKIVAGLPSKKTMVILHEIFGMPKGLK